MLSPALGEGRGGWGSEERAITTDAVRRALAGDLGNPQLVARAQAVADAQRFFHWPLEFPEVFERQAADGEWRIANAAPSTTPHSPSTIRHSPPTAPGFDVILGKPAVGANQASGGGVLRQPRRRDRQRAQRRRPQAADR
jgi:hypothetical protein